MTRNSMGGTLTTTPGFVTRNRQIVVRDSGIAGTDHLQRVYVLGCNDCGAIYGANGSDIFERRCPACQGGAPGLPFEKISTELDEEARKAFLEYEEVFVRRIVKKPGWRLVHSYLDEVLATGNEARVRAYIDDLRAARRDLEQALIA